MSMNVLPVYLFFGNNWKFCLCDNSSFRSIGDEAFMKAFEDTTLLFDDWSHEAHLRMAWNYIRRNGKEEALPLIR